MGRLAVAITVLLTLSYAVSGSDDCLYSQSGSARLAGFNSSYVGLVQVCKEGFWTAISFEEEGQWTKKNSIVVCRELGFRGAVGILMEDVSHSETPTSGNSLSPGEYYSVECTGLEEYLVDCAWSIRTVKSKKMDAVVLCREEPPAGELALVGINGKDSEGLVMLFNPFKTYSWSSVCATEWDDVDAGVACRQLGFDGGTSTSYSSSQVARFRVVPRKRYSYFDCLGSEKVLSECPYRGPYPYQCSSQLYAGVVCANEEQTDNTILNLNITLLVFMIVISILLIVILCLLLKCTLKKFQKRPSRRDCERASRVGRSQHINRVHLDQDMPYAVLPTIAPPSYQDTVLADQLIQTQNAESAITREGQGDEEESSLLVNTHRDQHSSPDTHRDQHSPSEATVY